MYQRILTSVDHVYSGNQVIKAIQSLAKRDNVSITLLHSIRKLPVFAFYFSLISLNNFESRYSKSIKNRLDYIAARQDIRCNTLVDFGSVQSTVRKYCNEKQTDLVVIKKGRAARSLLQSPPCDMLILNRV